jgi:hypothetical protein
LRDNFTPGNLEIRCFLALVPEERKSVIEKERLGRAVSSAISADRRPRYGLLSMALAESVAVARTAVMLIGVPGLLTKNTLSPSSLSVSLGSSAPADTAFASSSVGLCFSSGNTLLKLFMFAADPLLLDSDFSLATFALKNWEYSTSVSDFEACGRSSRGMSDKTVC